MARIRTIKPEYWADEKLAPLPPIDRLVYLGLISQADDAGRLVDSPRLLDGLLFPFTADSCGPSLDSLARAGVIVRGMSDSGQHVIQVVGWQKHQKVDHPNLKSVLPPILSTHSRKPREKVAHNRETVASRSRTIPTTDDRRPTTDDLHTDDRRPTTDAHRREASGEAEEHRGIGDGDGNATLSVPNDWHPDSGCVREATKRGKDLDFEIRELTAFWKREGIQPRNRNAALMRWLQKETPTFATPVPGSEHEVARRRGELPQDKEPRTDQLSHVSSAAETIEPKRRREKQAMQAGQSS